MFKKLLKEQTLVCLQLISSMTLIIILLMLNMLPMNYIIIISSLIFIVFCYLFLKMIQNRRRRKRVRKYKYCSLLTSICLLIASVYVFRGYSLLNNVSGENKQIYTYSLITLVDKTYEEVTDLNDENISMYFKVDTDYMYYVTDQLKEEINFKQIGSDSFKELANNLYDGEVEAILINEAYRTSIENEYPNFTSETKSVWTYGIEEEVTDFSKSVDVTKDTFNIYLSGTDTFGSVNTVSNSDVNLLVTINPTSKQILMTSIPRDLYVPLASSNGVEDKLTHAGSYGIQESVETIEMLFDIDINYYARVNFTSIVDIIDTLGGVNVYSKYSFQTLHGGYWISKGYNELSGIQALGFVRERYALPEGDYDRGINQTELLKAMLEKVMSPTVIKNYSSILDSISNCFTTNMTSNEIQSIIKMQLNDFATWEFSSQQVQGEGGMDYTYSYPYQELSVQYPIDESLEQITDIINEMMTGNAMIFDKEEE